VELSLMVLMACAWSCGSEHRYPTRDAAGALSPTDAGFGSVAARIAVAECPDLVVTLSPARAHIGETIAVAAHTSDPAAFARLTFAWSVSGGSFDSPTAPATTYHCPGRDQAGPRAVGLVASDGACRITRTATISCLALPDGGGPASIDGGGDAGAACTPGADPTTCEGQLCNQCTFDNCDTLTRTTTLGGVPIAGCDFYRTDLEKTQCQKAYACMRDRGCVRNSNPLPCWCGDVDPSLCEPGTVAGNGPCRTEIMNAAGSDDPVTVDERLIDPSFPIGGAVNLATCRSVHCSALGDESTACRL
jgi:hypothetical protein